MIKHEHPLVQNVGEQVAESLASLQEMFKPGTRCTFIARRSGFPDGSQDIVVTDDKLAEVIAALTIRKAAMDAEGKTED